MSTEPSTEPRFPDLYENYSITSPVLAENREDVFEDLHAHCPVARSTEEGGYWVVNGFEDVRRCAQDWKTFSDKDGIYATPAPQLLYPEDCDPPLHTALREMLNPYFKPKVMEEFEPEIVKLANNLVDDFIDDGEAELVSQFSDALAAGVFCSVIAGMPIEDMPKLQEDFGLAFFGSTKEEKNAGWLAASDYHAEYLAKRKDEEPRGDVVDAILAFEFEGFEWEDRVGCLTLLSSAGLATTSAVFTDAIYYLASHSDDRERLASDVALVPHALEEFIRKASAVMCVGRRVMADTEVAGKQISAGDWVYLNFGAANQDPARFPDEKEYDLDRWPNGHIAFGAGPHRCVGSHLARLDLRVALGVFLSRIPNFRLPNDFKPEYQTGVIRDMLRLPILFDRPGS